MKPYSTNALRQHARNTILLLSIFFTLPGESLATSEARWIWGDREHSAPKNRFTYFRQVVDLESIPEDTTLRFAADSNARLWINDNLVRRKVARYHEERITAETVNAGPYLHIGPNTIVVLHHNWGEITTFQRTGNKHAGLYLQASWLQTDATWRWITAPQYAPHEKQIVGVIKHARIRYGLIVDGRKNHIQSIVHDPAFDDSGWNRAYVVTDGPWPEIPRNVETPGQRESPCSPRGVVAAGKAEPLEPITEDPFSMAHRIRTANYQPSSALTRDAANLTRDRPMTLEGQAGETLYITVDFHRPIHGYPFLELGDAPEGATIDVGYTEVSQTLYDGKKHVDTNGWINPEGVVGNGYADRYITRRGAQSVEFADERTARWLAVFVHFPIAGRVIVNRLGMVKSQYPIKPTGSFACGREEIDQIVKLYLIHAEVTMTDAYVDTPGREDGQWIEDDRPRALLTERWFGDTQLRRFLIRTHAEGQGSDGNLHPFSPSNYPAYPSLYDWSVQWVAALHDEYMWTGETELIQTYWENLLRYWEQVLSLVNDDGLWLTNRVFADIRVGLRPQNEHYSSGIVTPWMIERLRWSATMAQAIGEADQAKVWTTTAEKMAKAFRQYHLVPADGKRPLHVADRLDSQDASIERGYSQAGQTVAVFSGLLTQAEALADLNYAFPAPVGAPPAGVTRWNNPTYGYRSLTALADCGLAERAVAHLIERYAPYLPGNPRNSTPLVFQGPYGGPLPEYWVSREDLGLKEGEINPTQPSDETGSHGWGALPLLWLHESLLGVRIAEPGGGRLNIAPATGGLPYIAGHTRTPKGDVWVYCDPQQWRLEVRIPAGVSADVTVPKAFTGKRIALLSPDKTERLIGQETVQIKGEGLYVFEVNGALR